MVKIFTTALYYYYMLLIIVVDATFNCSEPPNFGNFDVNSCCRQPTIDLEVVAKKCEKHVNGLKSSNDKYPAFAHLCYPECIYIETGALVNGKIHIDGVKQFLEHHVHSRDQEIIPHIVQSFEACRDNIHNHMQANNIGKFKALPQGCSPYASMIYSCVNAETFIHCPMTMWKTNRYCKLAKEFVEECNPLPHVPMPQL